MRWTTSDTTRARINAFGVLRDNPVRVAYNGANGKIHAVMPSLNHITRLQF